MLTAAPRNQGEARAPDSSGGNGVAPGLARQVLLVEDDPELAAVLCAALDSAGFRATSAATGEAAIDMVETQAFEAVIVDREMPDMDGLNLLSYLRRRLPGTPTICLTAFGGPLVEQAALERGASGYLEKPVPLHVLIRTVRAFIEGDSATSVATVSPREAPVPAHPRPTTAVVTPGPLWAVVLAGGRGVRLRPLTRRIHGESRPKQFAVLTGSSSLLHQTLDRTGLRIPRERTVVVGLREHTHYLDAEFAGQPAPTLLLQPQDRGTTPGILLPAHWIHARDPRAVVAVFPSDHSIGQPAAFMDHVTAVARFVDRHPDRLALVGALPTEPESEYGWIEPGEVLEEGGAGTVRAVKRFVEKPARSTARALLAAGALWNTFVLVARAATLVAAGQQFSRPLHEGLIDTARGADDEVRARELRQVYAGFPPSNFSSAILEQSTALLAVSTLSGVTWSDWGSPRRVLRALAREGLRPAWLRGEP